MAEEIKKLQEELEAAKFTSTFTSETLEEKEKEIESLKAQLEAVADKDLKIAELTEKVTKLETAAPVSAGSESEELAQARKKINELMLINQQLREETAESQKDIGEVMLTAKRQATKMIADAELEAESKIEAAEQELFNIGTKAKTIAENVKQSQEEANTIFAELIERLNKLEVKENN